MVKGKKRIIIGIILIILQIISVSGNLNAGIGFDLSFESVSVFIYDLIFLFFYFLVGIIGFILLLFGLAANRKYHEDIERVKLIQEGKVSEQGTPIPIKTSELQNPIIQPKVNLLETTNITKHEVPTENSRQKKQKKLKYCKYCGNQVYYGRCSTCKKPTGYLSFLFRASIIFSVLLILNVPVTFYYFSKVNTLGKEWEKEHGLNEQFDEFYKYNFLLLDTSDNTVQVISSSDKPYDNLKSLCLVDFDYPNIKSPGEDLGKSNSVRLKGVAKRHEIRELAAERESLYD